MRTELVLPGLAPRVSRVGLGCMSLSVADRPDRDCARRVIRTAVEAGVQLFDTADAYGLDDTDMGHNEQLLAETLAEMGHSAGADNDRLVVATKGGRLRPQGRWTIDGRPDHLRTACEASLRRLGTDCIALYQLHTPDPEVPIGDSVGALSRLREEGKVRSVGLSNVSVAELEIAARIVPIATVQNALGPWDVPLSSSSMLDACESAGAVLLAHSPLGGSDRVKALRAAPALGALAAKLGVTPVELALHAVLLHVSSCVVLPGASREASVLSSRRALELRLDEGDLARLARALRALPGRRGLFSKALLRLVRGLRGN